MAGLDEGNQYHSLSREELRELRTHRQDLNQRKSDLYDDLEAVKRGRSEFTDPTESVEKLRSDIEHLFSAVPPVLKPKSNKVGALTKKNSQARIDCHNDNFVAAVKGRRIAEPDYKAIVSRKLRPDFDPHEAIKIAKEKKLNKAQSAYAYKKGEGVNFVVKPQAAENPRLALQQKKEAQAKLIVEPRKPLPQKDFVLKEKKVKKDFVPRCSTGPKHTTEKHVFEASIHKGKFHIWEREEETRGKESKNRGVATK